MSDQVKFNKLHGSKVLITGGTSGIGFAVAEGVLESGGSVAVSSSNAERVNEAVAKLQSLYPSAKDRVSGHVCDLADEANLENNIRGLFEAVGGPLDHVVHTAGGKLTMSALDQLDFDTIRSAGTVRFFAPFFLAKYAAKYVRSSAKSSLLLTSGAAGEHPEPLWTVVSAFCAGMDGLVRGLALDLKPIRVNLVSPGAVNTELFDKVFAEDVKKSFFTHLESKLPTGKIASPYDVAETYLYLMKDSNITGSKIQTNGGSLLV